MDAHGGEGARRTSRLRGRAGGAATVLGVTEISERYRTIADTFAARVEGIPADRWSSPSPCEGWTARDVALHVVDVHRRLVEGIADREPLPLPADVDVVEAWRDARAAVEAILADPVRARQISTGRFSPLPFEALVGRLLCADTLVHTWDLARATGQDERLDPEAVTHTYGGLKPMDATLRGSGAFGARLEAPDGADEQTELLCFLGRTV